MLGRSKWLTKPYTTTCRLPIIASTSFVANKCSSWVLTEGSSQISFTKGRQCAVPRRFAVGRRVAAGVPEDETEDEPSLMWWRGLVSSAVLKFCRAAIAFLLGATTLAAFTVSLTPYLLSQRPVLSAALVTTNALFLPADAQIQIDSVSAGWTSPLEVRGMRLVYKQRGVCGTAAAATTTLCSAERLRTVESLLTFVLRAGWDNHEAPLDIIISAPQLNLCPDTNNALPLVKVLEHARLIPEPLLLSDSALAVRNERETKNQNSPNNIPESMDINVSDTVALPFTGEITNDRFHLALTDGSLMVPPHLASLFKHQNLHVEVLQGVRAMKESGETLNHVEHDIKELGKIIAPVGVRIDSPVFVTSFKGWKTEHGYTILEAPAKVILRLTPDVASYLLYHVNPLLNNVVSVTLNRHGTASKADSDLKGPIQASIAPIHNVFPASHLTIQVDPIRVVLGKSLMLDNHQLLGDVLTVITNTRFGESAKSNFEIMDATIDAFAVHVQTETGNVQLPRMDLHFKMMGMERPLKLICWGSVPIGGEEEVSFTVGVPKESLSAITGVDATLLPPGYAIPIRITGSPSNLEIINAPKAMADIALLVLEGRAREPAAVDWLLNDLSRITRGIDMVRIPEKLECA